jgi:signal transduction histidine kinase
MADLAAVLSQAGFAENPSVLDKVKTIVGGHLATVDAQGAVIASTLDRESARAFARYLADDRPVAGAAAARTRTVRLGGELFRVTYAPVDAPPWRPGQTFLYLLAPEGAIQEAADRAARPVLVAAACGAVAAIVIGVLVAYAIARPVQVLAAQARLLAAGDATARLAVRTRDEVGDLAEAFNALLDSLRHAEERLVASERLAAVGQVAAGIAHEVRNPLSGVRMSAQLLGRRLRELGSPDDESVAIMLAEIARLEVIIDDLLTFAGPMHLARETSDLNAVIRGVLDFMARQLDHAGVVVRRELDEGIGPAQLDARRIRQVVLNLLLNASEAMPHGGTLTVRTRGTPEAVVAEFDDTGHGMPPDVAPKIFDPFFTTKRGGSGLGLGVSRTLIEAHGGTLDFEPLPVGTRFRFTIPRVSHTEATESAERRANAEHPTPKTDNRKPTT